MIKNQENSNFVASEDGLRLADSGLWFDSYSNGKVTFLSSADMHERSFIPQVMATEETLQLLRVFRRKPASLICQYNRPFSVGRHSLELLPGGNRLGAANLYVESRGSSLLYAHSLQGERSQQLRGQQTRKAETLALGAFFPLPLTQSAKRKKEKRRFLETLVGGEGETTIYCPPTMAPELTSLLNEASLEVAVHPLLYMINRIYEDSGCYLGQRYFSSTSRKASKRLLLVPNTGAISRQLGLSPDVVFIKRNREISVHFNQGLECFDINPVPDHKQIETFIEQVKPRDLVFFGPYAKAYTHEFNNSAKSVSALPSNQPSLF